MSDLSLAILGCGYAAALHSRTLRRLAPRLPRYYASRAREKANSFNRSLKGAGWYNSYQAALADPRVTVVLITTPPATHLQLTLAALQQGKHVIVEKPAYLLPEEFDTVEIAAQQAQRQVLVAENYYYKPSAYALRSLLAEEEIGELRLAFINALKWQRRAGWRASEELAGGGPLFEGGVHWISLLASLGPEVVSAHVNECGSPLTSVFTARFNNGGVAVLAYSWEMRSRLHGLRLSRIYGTRGSITFESNGLFVLLRGRRTRLLLPGPTDLLGYRAMFRDFLTVIEHDWQPQFTLRHARRDVALLRSAETK